jgi:hypothetical protein
MSSTDDRAALVQLFETCGGDAWTTRTGWTKAGPLASWHGVSTDADGRVVGLELSSNNVRGTAGALAEAVTRLERIAQLWLSDNLLTGTPPPALARMPALAVLDLGRNRLTGALPREFRSAAFTWLDTSENALSCYHRAAEGDEAQVAGATASFGRGDVLQRVFTCANAIPEAACGEMVRLAEAAAARHGWETERHRQYQTTDVDVANDEALLRAGNAALAAALLPLVAASFEIPVWRCAVEDLFVCKYEAGAGQAGLGVHRDDSEVSFVVLLNDPSEFEGGGTRFVRCETPPAFQRAGGCVLFCGLREHAGRPITGGVPIHSRRLRPRPRRRRDAAAGARAVPRRREQEAESPGRDLGGF